MFIFIIFNFCNFIIYVILDGNCGVKLDWVLNMDCISKLYIFFRYFIELYNGRIFYLYCYLYISDWNMVERKRY